MTKLLASSSYRRCVDISHVTSGDKMRTACAIVDRWLLDSAARGGQCGAMKDFALPDECETMLQVRAGVDATDRELMVLIERRFAYMRAAARIKTERGAVRDERRKAAVIANVLAEAQARELPAVELVAIWERLVEASIAYELVEWDRLRADATASRSGVAARAS